MKRLFVKNLKELEKKKRSKNITIFKRGWKRGESKCTWEQKKKSTRGFRKGGATA